MILSPQFLEAVNGVLLAVHLAILLVFGRYIVEGLCEHGWHEGRRQRNAAIGIFTLVAGDALIRGCIWTLRHLQNNGRDSEALAMPGTIGTTIGVLICIIGGICVLRHFAPARLGPWPWIVTMVTALAFGIGMAL